MTNILYKVIYLLYVTMVIGISIMLIGNVGLTFLYDYTKYMILIAKIGAWIFAISLALSCIIGDFLKKRLLKESEKNQEGAE